MNELSCRHFRPLAPELALNGLVGRERAQMLAHLADCPNCRTTTSALTRTADQLIELIPEAEPPAGFELRVITAVRPCKTRVRRSPLAVAARRAGVPSRHRWPVPVIAILLAVVLTGGGWFLGRSNPPNAPPDNDAVAGVRTVMYAPLTSDSRQVGQAFFYPDEPSWMYVTLATDSVPDSTISCEIVRSDGSTVVLGTFPFSHGHGEWGVSAPVKLDTISRAALTDPQGHIVASGDFQPPSPQTSPAHSTLHTRTQGLGKAASPRRTPPAAPTVGRRRPPQTARSHGPGPPDLTTDSAS